jgi:hypothetical protein
MILEAALEDAKQHHKDHLLAGPFQRIRLPTTRLSLGMVHQPPYTYQALVIILADISTPQMRQGPEQYWFVRRWASPRRRRYKFGKVISMSKVTTRMRKTNKRA